MKKKLVATLIIFAIFISLLGCSAKRKVRAFVRENSYTMDEMNEKYADAMQFSMKPEGENLVINFKFMYLTEFDEDNLTMIKQENIQNFNVVYGLVKEYTGNENIKVYLRYYNANDELVDEDIIDADHIPTEKTPTNTSLEEYVNNALFQNLIKRGNSDEFTMEAVVEDGSTVVILYRFNEEIDHSTLDQSRAYWEENLSEEKQIKDYKNLRTMLQERYPDEKIQLKIRITDHTNETFYEKTID